MFWRAKKNYVAKQNGIPNVIVENMESRKFQTKANTQFASSTRNYFIQIFYSEKIVYRSLEVQ